MTNERFTNLKLSSADAQAWRELAAACQVYLSRGVGAGEIGNGAEAVRRVARAYRRDPVATLAAVRSLLLDQEGA